MTNKSKEFTTDLRVYNSSRVFVGFTANDLAPGLKTSFSFTEPDRSCNAELQYQNEYVGISTNIGVSYKPIINFSGVLGNNNLSLGSDISYNSASGNLGVLSRTSGLRKRMTETNVLDSLSSH
ncbi:Mitochondrial outer membrane protein porin [Thalictrum thalictroides]|uniref:Mitochondrial outer membrane protein porin n=1 Tax=Thalictrum thalictroides TaxID=46969 RepID=A0A7J6X7H6_THATH|nr:Mitochondrial outer membrane protein porin [Thalictrum thalictroides]